MRCSACCFVRGQRHTMPRFSLLSLTQSSACRFCTHANAHRSHVCVTGRVWLVEPKARARPQRCTRATAHVTPTHQRSDFASVETHAQHTPSTVDTYSAGRVRHIWYHAIDAQWTDTCNTTGGESGCTVRVANVLHGFAIAGRVWIGGNLRTPQQEHAEVRLRRSHAAGSSVNDQHTQVAVEQQRHTHTHRCTGDIVHSKAAQTHSCVRSKFKLGGERQRKWGKVWVWCKRHGLCARTLACDSCPDAPHLRSWRHGPNLRHRRQTSSGWWEHKQHANKNKNKKQTNEHKQTMKTNNSMLVHASHTVLVSGMVSAADDAWSLPPHR